MLPQPGRLIVGLGNPGPGYAHHRHNVGFMVVDRFAARHGLRFGKREASALVATGSFEGEPLALAKPQAFMNRSGGPVQSLVRRYTRGPANLIVVYDEMDLPLGRLRIRQEGSHGGHNGMRDIIAALGTQEFVRVRLGVGRPPSGEDGRSRAQPVHARRAADRGEHARRRRGRAGMHAARRYRAGDEPVQSAEQPGPRPKPRACPARRAPPGAADGWLGGAGG